MPSYNFAAGPATLPQPVLEQVQAELLDYHGTGLSILEISHRSAAFEAIYQSASQRLLRLLKLSAADYTPLFLQGGCHPPVYDGPAQPRHHPPPGGLR